MQRQYCLLLNPSLLTQSYFAAKSTTIWLSLYRVQKVLTKPNYLIRKFGTPYTQFVHRIRLRPITPNYQVEDIQLTMDDFRPDPSSGKYRSEHEMFDDALYDLIREGKLYDPNLDKQISKKKNDVEYVIGGAAVVPAATREDLHLEAQNAVPEEYQYPPLQPAPEPAPLEEVENQLFPEPLQPAAPVQVHFDSPEPGVSPKPNPNQEITLTRTEMSDTQAKTRPSRIPIKSSSAQSTPAASPTIRFDQNGYHRGIPSRQDLAKKGYYAYLEQQATTPPSVDTKRTMLRNIASTTRQKLVNSIPSAPTLTQMPGKSILKNRYPIRSNRGQPPASSDVHSPNFQFNQISNVIGSILLPPNNEILHGDLLENPHTNFRHCVSSDLVMAAGIATHFLRLFPDLNDIRQRKMFLPPGSLIAHFSQQRQNRIYNLVTKKHGNDKPTHQNLHRSLCRMKSHMLEHGIKEIISPQNGCGLDKLEWTKALTDIIRIFGHSGICVKLFLRKWPSNPMNENLINAEECDKDEETNRRLIHMCTASKLAFERLLQNPPP